MIRVLHLPVNYGSLPSHTVRLLRLGGIDAYGLVFSKSAVQSAEGMKLVADYKANRVRMLLNRIRWFANVVHYIALTRPDIIHWYFGKEALPFGLDLALVKRLNIPRLVEWQGSDIRRPDLESAGNPYFAQAFADANYEYRDIERAENSLQRQQRFARAGFFSVAPIGMLQYIDKSIFPHSYSIPQRIILTDYTPVYPDPHKRKPLVVHSTTAPVVKGTNVVLRAIDQLKGEHEFDFQLIRGMQRPQALQLMQRADVFLDQFVLGDRGMSALEALAFGKPVICYIKPSLAQLYPVDDPIVNARPEVLSSVLARLIFDGKMRYDLGQRGRHFAEREYDPQKIVAEIKAIYQDVLNQAT